MCGIQLAEAGMRHLGDASTKQEKDWPHPSNLFEISESSARQNQIANESGPSHGTP